MQYVFRFQNYNNYVTWYSIQDNKYKCNITNLPDGEYIGLIRGGNCNAFDKLICVGVGLGYRSCSGFYCASAGLSYEDCTFKDGNIWYISGHANGWGSTGILYKIIGFPIQ